MVLFYFFYFSTFALSGTTTMAYVVQKSFQYTEESPPQKDNNKGVGLKTEGMRMAVGVGVEEDNNCGQIEYLREPRVIGGRVAYKAEFPWIVSLQTDGYHSCGGTIIGRRHILTAAHCFEAVTNENHQKQLRVIVGGHNLTRINSTQTRLIKIKKIIMHEKYENSQKIINDIAILVLEEEINWSPYVRKICLPTQEYIYGDVKAKASGWGRTWGEKQVFAKFYDSLGKSNNNNNIKPMDPEKGKTEVGTIETTPSQNEIFDESEYTLTSDILKAVNLTIFNNTYCNEIYKEYNFYINQKQICAGASYLGEDYKAGDIAQGDSGGPLSVKLDGRWTIAGITSSSLKFHGPAIYVRVSEYLEWIRRHLNED